MAAIAYPSYEAPERGPLRLVSSPARRRPVASPAPRRPLHPSVYRRRRLVVAAVVAIVLALAVVGGSTVLAHFSGSSAGSPGPADGPVLVSSQVHVVQPGETYWSIAEELDEGGDVRDTVDALVAGNDGRPLQAGDRLVLPR